MHRHVLRFILLILCTIAHQQSFAQDNTILSKVANAHGFENWKNVETIEFTFNVDRDTTHFERSWVWNTKTNEVTSETDEETQTYKRGAMDSTMQKTDANFINDKYWLLAPYQIMWDADNFEHEYTAEANAPMSNKPMQKLTIVYGSEGGYTPGDAYDFYFMDDNVIREWVFRKGNQKEASMTTTWEEYQNYEGLEIATSHKNEEGNFRLYFTDVDVTTK